MKAIADFVAEIKSDTLYLEQNLYLNIDHLTCKSLLESKISFIIATSQQIKIKIDSVRYNIDQLPKWFNKITNNKIEKIPKFIKKSFGLK